MAKNNTKKTTQLFINDAIAIHGDRYDYSLVEYHNNKTPVKVICPIHGVFEQKPNQHLSGQGCPDCGKIKAAKKRHITNAEFIERAKRVHGDKYDYSEVDMVDMRTNVTIICPKHGRFRPLPKPFLAGGKCPECAREEKLYCKKLTNEEFIEKAKLAHPTGYSFEHTVYKGMNKPVVVTCERHGDVTVRPTWFLAGSGCRFCGMEKKMHIIEGFGTNDIVACSREPSYKKWLGMLKRCRNKKALEKHPTYKGCSIDPRWAEYSEFKKWYDENYYEGAEELDKDILSGPMNRVYGPDTCLLVPKRINAIFVGMRRKNKYGFIGVHKSRNGETYEAHGCFSEEGKSSSFGAFKTPEETFLAYKEKKESFIKRMADKFFSEGLIPEKVRDALYRYEVTNPY